MTPGDQTIGPLFLFAGLANTRETIEQVFIGVRDQCGKHPRDTKPKMWLQSGQDVFGSEVGLAEPDSTVTIYLQIVKRGRDDGE